MIGARRLSPLLVVAALVGPRAGAEAPVARPASEWARYQLHGERPWKNVAVLNQPGYRVILGSVDGQELTARVEVDAAPLPDVSPFPLEPATLPEEARTLLSPPPPNDPEAEMLARMLTRGAATVLEAVERVVSYTSRRIQYELPTSREETAESCRRLGRGSCVGRSLLAADLLLRCGIPVRQVTGILVAENPRELAGDARAVYSESLGGVRHRWIEAYVPGLGWVPSDPGGLANTVSARHLALSRAPEPDFGVTVISKTAELRWPALATLGKGLTLGRPRGRAGRADARAPWGCGGRSVPAECLAGEGRADARAGASLVVRNTGATRGGAVVLSPLPSRDAGNGATSRVLRADSSAVRFDRVPVGDYRVVWKSPDGRIEAASVRVDGPAEVEIGGRSAAASPARSGS